MSTKRDAGEAFGDHPATKTNRHKRLRRTRTKIIAEAGSVPDHKEEGRPHKKKLKNRVHTKEKKIDVAHDDAWNQSESSGGLFLEQDPILTEDGKYLLLPTKSEVQVYSAATSLLVRSIQVGIKDDLFNDITSCALSAFNPTEIFVSTRRGIINKCDWTTGQRLEHWTSKPGLLRVLGCLGDHNKCSHGLLLHYKTEQGDHQIICHKLSHQTRQPEKSLVLVTQRSYFADLRLLASGAVLVLGAGKKLLIGYNEKQFEVVDESPYVWREVVVPGEIVSMDARQHQSQIKSNRSPKTGVDVVLGFKDGVVMIYEDILHRLIGKEKNIKPVEISSRRLHWHREGVNTVKWSKDGNYLVSGGNEAVLVIWQLDTNQQQFLPHLSAPIRSLSISQMGSSYTVMLADNSVMVLATADLLPSANVSGLALDNILPSDSVVLSPINPSHLMAAVPTLRQTKQISQATHLQTFDIPGNLQISRQALTRNITTVVKASPAGQKLQEPNVVLLNISHDGKWLVTVDEWTPPDADANALSSRNDRTSRRPEVTLRFWSWNAKGITWELVTRIDDPHSGHNILGMAVNPIRQEVTTIGGDARVRIWSPKARFRNAVPIKDREGDQLRTWTCSYVGHIEKDVTLESTSGSMSASLAYSEDASVIAASWSSAANVRLIHFIDSRTGTIHLSQPNLLTDGRAQLAFIGRYLICLSRKLCIWDTVSLNTSFSMTLNETFISEGSTRMLAVDRISRTFALALNSAQRSDKAQIVCFDMDNLIDGPVFRRRVYGRIGVLLARPKMPGFVAIDNENRIRIITPPGMAALSTIATDTTTIKANKSLNDVFGAEASFQRSEGDNKVMKALPATESQTSWRSLEDLLGSHISSSQIPSVGDIFEKVAGMFVRTPVVA